MLEKIFEKYPDHEFLIADGLDEAVIGVHEKSLRLIYSCSKCEDILIERDGMEFEEAREFLDFNTYQAYMGPKTPIWFYDDGDEEGMDEGYICNRDGCMGLIVGGENEEECDTCDWKFSNEK